jgi:prenyltransferase beta subunit
MSRRFAPLLVGIGLSTALLPAGAADTPSAKDIRAGLRNFFAKTAQPDGSFRPGIDPDYKGMADTAYSDLAAPTYAVVLHRTFSWKLPYPNKTRDFFLSRQGKDGAFFNVAGTADPKSSQARLYNTTQGLVALHALGVKPRHDPVPVLEEVLRRDYKGLPPYTTSFFPLAYLAAGRPFPPQAEHKVRALLVQAEDGYIGNHVASTFHAVHYYRLLNEPTPKADAILRRVLHDQRPDGSWLFNPPARDRHATFDAVFVLTQLGAGRDDCRRAVARAATWALSCRNADGGFGHYPGSPSDADAVYFQVGTLVMAGILRPVDLPSADARLLGWGHVMPSPKADK